MNADSEDRKLLERMFAGDEAAGKCLYRKYRDFVFYLLKNEGIKGEEAFDCMQDVFKTVLTDPKLSELDTKFLYYLLRVLYNKIKDIYRHRKRYKVYAINENGELYSPLVEGKKQSLDTLFPQFDEFSDFDFQEAVEVCLKRLPRPDWRVIIKMWLENFKIRHIAEALHIPEGTIASRLSRAREFFKQCMEKNYWQ
ncbi:RNA polymerase sigma factor [candidate division KSB1 bacterium]|nr:RNA polymerase sigma factor [candidate division KSB1 bacterium]